MKFYLLFFISLNLAYCGNAQNVIDVRNIESTLSSTDYYPGIPNTESTLGLKENILLSHTENTINSTKKFLTSSTESTLNSTENELFISSLENTSNSEENTTSITIPESNCPENMIAAETNPANGNWTCLCPNPFVILTKTLCSELWREGPCGSGNFLVQSLDPELLPQCIPNPCLEDGLVPYEGTCSNITVLDPCHEGRPFYFEEIKRIACRINLTLFSWKPSSATKCPLGSRKDRHGICRRKL